MESGGEHIYNNHIDGDPVTKSQYENDIPPVPKAAMLPMVIGTNAMTFDLGSASQAKPGANIVFTYRFPQYPYKVPGGTVVGLGRLARNMGGGATAWNTLVLGPDCRYVVTSHPGVP
jgi:hypothetical protein